MIEDIAALNKEFQTEARDFCIKAGDRGIRCTVVWVIEDPLKESTVASYSGASMSLYETIGILEATSHQLKYNHCQDNDAEDDDA